MRIVITEFISLDGVVQAPGGPEEDTDGGFAHGGWSHPFFDRGRRRRSSTTRWRAPTRCCSGGARGRRWPRRGPSVRAIRSPTG